MSRTYRGNAKNDKHAPLTSIADVSRIRPFKLLLPADRDNDLFTALHIP